MVLTIDGRLRGLPEPVASGDGVSKSYVEGNAGMMAASRAKAGKHQEFIFQGVPAFIGHTNGGEFHPRFQVGSAGAAGAWPSGTKLYMAVLVHFKTTSAATTGTAGIVNYLDGTPGTIQIYSANHATHPSKLRWKFRRESDGVDTEVDWTTWANDEVALIEAIFTVSGASSAAGYRLSSVELRKNGVGATFGNGRFNGGSFIPVGAGWSALNDCLAWPLSPVLGKLVLP